MLSTTSRWSRWAPMAGIILLACFPYFSLHFGLDYYTGFIIRLMILAIVVTSLNFLLGYGGMIALGHAGFIGIGSYAMVALVEAGIDSVWLLWLGATLVTVVAATLIGLVVLRTRGIYFLMSTLAFAEMVYYIAVSLRQYGGDDGYILALPLTFGLGLDAADANTLYMVVLAVFVLIFLFLNRTIDSRFGKAITGIRDNATRMQVLGYPTFKLQLQGFVIGSSIAGLAGAMMMTQNGFISPTTIHWTHSAELMVIVALGGMGYKWGAIVGAGVWGVLKEFLPQVTDYWHWPLGLMVIAIILYAPNGLWPLFAQESSPQKRDGLIKLIRRQV